ncbi:Ig-like domain-containing protein [Flavobacterium cerinum]|uniref:T9SS type A sorting domain-containing protein n=1 Tax=Flavobacterium cerinum TaxID=2502784 RepID=A0A3S3QTX3_9FLAO|nr:Ig-like domain-containing protein [Flavobacterium cerinum]RWX03480.1 T9SS type A sorting domain-containing protein [Flavobacterium cerinum]
MFKFYKKSNKRYLFGKAMAAVMLFFFCTQLSFAQASAYGFTQNQGTYVPLTGATIIAQAGALTGTNSIDSQKYELPAGTIPFPFTISNQSFTGLYVYADGFVTFGPNFINGSSPISNAVTEYAGAVSAAAADIHALYDLNGLTGSISYKTEGVAPNREFVIQWEHFRPYLSSTSTSSLFDWNFQIRLKENNGISIAYDMKVTGTPTSALVQVGIRTGSATDYSNRYSTGTSSSNWTSSTAGSSATSTTTVNSGTLPPSGFSYNWSSPLPCISPVVQPTVLNLSSQGIIITGTFTKAVPAADSYLVLRTPTGTVPNTPVNGTVYTVAANTALNANVIYIGSNATFTDNAFNGVLGNTDYTYTVYAVSTACIGGPIYNAISPLTADITTCPGPINTLDSANVSSSSFGIVWTPNNGNALPLTYSVEVSTVSDFATQIPGSPFTVAAPAASINIPGLLASTKYFYRIKAITSCGTGLASSIKNVTTLCVAVTALNENFDALTFGVLPSCWSKIIRGSGTSSASVGASVSAGFSLPAAINLYNSSANTNTDGVDVILVTPTISNLNAGTHRLRFKAKRGTAVEGNDIQIGTLSDNSATAVFTAVGGVTVLTTEYKEYTVYLTGNNTTNQFLGFKRKGSAANTNIFIDDVIWEEAPSCLEPLNLSVSAIAPNSATVSWNFDAHSTAPTDGYEYFVSTTNTAPTVTDVVVSTNSTTVNLALLANGTAHYVFVRSVCSSANKSAWKVIDFKTILTTPAPWTETFTGTSLPGWVTTGWTIGADRSATGNTGRNIYKNLFGTTPAGEFSTINVGPLPANSVLSFDYKQGNYNSPYTPLTDWGNFEVQVSTDFGATWTSLAAITNEAGTGSYMAKTYPLSAYENMYVSVKIKAARTTGDFDLSFDNFKIEANNTPVSLAIATQNAVPAQISVPNGTLQLIASVLPTAANQNVIWSITSGSEFGTINASGQITATANGTVTVKAVSTVNAAVFNIIQVVISGQIIPVVSLVISVENNAASAITTANGTLQLVATVLPAAATQNIIWSVVSGAEFGTVNATGLITATANGIVTIQAVSTEDATILDTIEIAISGQITPVASVVISVENNAAPAITTANGTLQLVATVLPVAATQNVIWSVVSGAEFGTVNATGLITATANGIVTIQAVSTEDATILDTIEIAISGQITPVASVVISVENNAAPAITTANGTLQLVATVLPVAATQNVIWSVVSGAEFGTVNATGLITATANGIVTIQAVSTEDATILDTIEILISNQVLGIDEVTKAQFVIYPNPAEAVLTIQSVLEVAAVTVYNLLGQTMAIENNNTINIENLSVGTYIIKVDFTNGKSTAQKIIKK